MSKKHGGSHKMATGGVTGIEMRKYGRNLARAMHQANPGKLGAKHDGPIKKAGRAR
jgi:hypothetical protein